MMNNDNLASAQFTRKKNSSLKILVASFSIIFILGTAANLFFLSGTQKNEITPSGINLIAGIPSTAMSVELDPPVPSPVVKNFEVPGVSVTEIARWRELSEQGEVAVHMLKVSAAASDYAPMFANYAGVFGITVSGAQTSDRGIGYTFYKEGVFGEIFIIPESASTSKVIVKQ